MFYHGMVHGFDLLLTNAQKRVAKAIAAAEQRNTPLFAPELTQILGFAGESSLTPALKILQRKGIVEILGGGKQRAFRLIRLTQKGRMAMGLNGLPLLGSIPAGPLADSIAQADEFAEVNSLLKYRPGDFLLKTSGDSMTGDGIFDGDLVLLRPEIDLFPGEIAAVHAGGNYESTLKRVFVEAEQVRLKASNPKYRDIIVPRSEWQGIAGVFRGLVRNVSR